MVQHPARISNGVGAVGNNFVGPVMGNNSSGGHQPGGSMMQATGGGMMAANFQTNGINNKIPMQVCIKSDRN